MEKDEDKSSEHTKPSHLGYAALVVDGLQIAEGILCITWDTMTGTIELPPNHSVELPNIYDHAHVRVRTGNQIIEIRLRDVCDAANPHVHFSVITPQERNAS